jgi:drug/metabolite transporter (DMT)-like permease
MKEFLNNIDKGVLYMLGASFLFAILGVAAAKASQSLPSVEVVFFRNVFGVVIIGYAIYKSPLKQIGGKPWLLLFRGMMGFLALLAFFYNIAHIPLGDAMTFSKTSPIFTAIFAFLFLNEKLNRYAILALASGFLGIIFITDPTGFSFSKTDILGIFSGIGAALAYTSIRELKNYYDTKAIVLSFMGVGTIGPILIFLVALFYQNRELDFMLAPFVMPNGTTWIYIIILGITSTMAQVLMTKAYSSSKAGIIAAVSYTNIVFSIIMGMLFLSDPFPDNYKIIGIILVITSGLLVIKKD